MHAFSAGTAAVFLHHRMIEVLVKHHAQVFQPLDHQRGIQYQRLHQIGVVGKVTAADHIQIVNGRRVFSAIGGLDAALGHHGVGVAKAQLRHQSHFGAVIGGQNGCAGSGPATADDEDIGINFRLAEVKAGLDERASFHHIGQFMRHAHALVGTNFDWAHGRLNIIGVKRLQNSFAFFHRHGRISFRQAARPGGFNDLD